jgi:hypothetical protein
MTQAMLDHHIQWVAQEDAEYANYLRDTVGRAGRHVWTSDLQVRRAHVFNAAYRLLTALDPRFESLRDTSIAPQIATLLLQQQGSPAAFTTSDEAASDVLWVQNQYPTFTLTAGLCANLLLTDPGKVVERDVPWPFPAYRVVLPHPSPIQFLNTEQEVVDMLDFRVLQWQARGVASPEHARNVETINLTPIHNMSSIDAFQRGLRRVLDDTFEVLARTPAEPAVLVRGYGPSGVSVFQNQAWLGDRNVQEWLDGQELPVATGSALAPTLPMMPGDKLAIASAQRLAVNLALWLCSRDEKTGKPVWTETKPRAGDRRLRNWVVGQTVKVSREVREAATELANGRISRAAVQVRHIVRGHFRNQPFGPGRVDRRRIYIAPFWRGPASDEPTSPRVYRVEE